MPSLRATAAAVVWLSPVSMTTRSPERCRSRMASGASALMGSAMPSSPAAWPSTAAKTTVWPSRRMASAFDRQFAGSDAELFQQTFVAHGNLVTADSTDDTSPGQRTEPLCGNKLHSVCKCSLDDRGGQRVLAAALQAGDQLHDALFGFAAEGDHRHQLGLALGERSGLVERQRCDLLQCLQRLGVLDEDASARAASSADHDCHGRRQAQRARARDDQHGDGIDDRVRQARLGPAHANHTTKVTAADTQHCGNEIRLQLCPPVAEWERGCAVRR